MKAMILAAGLGTRLSPYTDVLAKPAIPFLNIPLLYYSIALTQAAIELSVDEYIINSHHKPEQIKQLTRDLSKNPNLKSLKTTTTFENEKPLGSGGGVWFAREHFTNGEDFIVTNGDEVILPTHLKIMDQMLKQHRNSKALVTLLVKRDSRVGTQFGGAWANSRGRVFGFGKINPNEVPAQKCKEPNLEAFHYVGVLMMNKRAMKYFPDGESNILYDAAMSAHHAGEKIEVFIDDCRWYETGNIKDYLHATEQVLEELRKNPKDVFINELLKKFAPGSHLQIQKEAMIFADKSVKIPSSAKLTGFVVLGPDVKVPDGCELHNVVVRENAILRPQSYKEDLILK